MSRASLSPAWAYSALSGAQERGDVPNRAAAAMQGGRGRGGGPAVSGEGEDGGRWSPSGPQHEGTEYGVTSESQLKVEARPVRGPHRM